MGAMHMHFKAYRVSISSIIVLFFFQFGLQQDSMLKILLVVFVICVLQHHIGCIKGLLDFFTNICVL